MLNLGDYREAREAYLRAQATVNAMKGTDWGKAYPGNDPRIYQSGISSMKNMIGENLKVTEEKLSTAKDWNIP
jgi:hypothetical protein